MQPNFSSCQEEANEFLEFLERGNIEEADRLITHLVNTFQEAHESAYLSVFREAFDIRKKREDLQEFIEDLKEYIKRKRGKLEENAFMLTALTDLETYFNLY